jgi:predicted aminopeptidase
MGQLDIVWNARPFEEFLAKSDYPDSTKRMYKQKLDFIRAIKRFAVDSLGLNDTKNYDKIFDQKGKPLLWAVTASEPYQLKPKEWNYGPMGDMPYKGFFDSTRAKNLVKSLEKEGYDTHVYSPAGWSTLGWFADPVLSSMLHWEEGDLASLIIHEMTHGTIWVTGGIEFNENLADFIGDKGALLYLASKYGQDSKEYQDYIKGDLDGEKFYKHILRGAERLDSLYKTFREKDTKTFKNQKKYALIEEIIDGLGKIGITTPKRSAKKFKRKLPNNAYFMNFRRYRSKQNQFEDECNTKFKADLKQYIIYLKQKFPQ